MNQKISLEGVSLIPYRDLEKTDFKAKQLPEDIRIWSDRLNAHTSISIRPAEGAKFSITQTDFSGRAFYVGSIKNLTFEAVMIPEHSWWSPRVKSGRTPYVLQHEQIHFALMEIAARRLSKDIKARSQELVVFEDTPLKARNKLSEKISELISNSKILILREHIRFDEDTSGYYVPEVQQQWYEKVVKELRQLEAE